MLFFFQCSVTAVSYYNQITKPYNLLSVLRHVENSIYISFSVVTEQMNMLYCESWLVRTIEHFTVDPFRRYDSIDGFWLFSREMKWFMTWTTIFCDTVHYVKHAESSLGGGLIICAESKPSTNVCVLIQRHHSNF